VDAARPAGMMVAGAVRSGARLKLEDITGGQQWWVVGTAQTNKDEPALNLALVRSNKVLILVPSRNRDPLNCFQDSH